MARFEGATYLRRTLPLLDVADSKKALISGWFRAADGEGGTIFVGGAGAGATQKISFTQSVTSGEYVFLVRNSSNTILWQATTDDAYDDDAYHHVAISMDLGAARGQIYIDGAAADFTANTALTDGTVPFSTASEWVFGAFWNGAATLFTGSCYDFAFWPGISTDLSDVENLQLLVAIDSGADRVREDPSRVKPVGYGFQGRYLGEPAPFVVGGSCRQNLGSGGDFLLTGTTGEDPTDETAPSAAKLFPRWRTPGERWFLSELSGTPYPRSQTFIEQRPGLTTFGKRHGLEEMDSTTRRERPGFNFTDLVLGLDDEDDDEDFFR